MPGPSHSEQKSIIARALQLLSLVNGRRWITLQEIVSELGVSERTAYRYVNMLSEVNIPIYYDRYAGRYRILSQVNYNVDEFSLTDLVTTGFAVQYLHSELGHITSKYLASLSRKLAKKCNSAHIQYIPAIKSRVKNHTLSTEVSYLYNYSLILGGINASRGIEIHFENARGMIMRRRIFEPTIIGGEEVAVGNRADCKDPILVRDIRRVVVL